MVTTPLKPTPKCIRASLRELHANLRDAGARAWDAGDHDGARAYWDARDRVDATHDNALCACAECVVCLGCAVAVTMAGDPVCAECAEDTEVRS